MPRNPKLMKAFNKLHLKTRYANEEAGTVGKPNGTVLITGKPNLIWVTTARGATVKAINQGVPETAGYPCILERNRDNDWVATKGDGQRAVNFAGSGGGTGAVGPHSHRLGFGLENYVEALRLEEGLVHPTNPVSLSVYIEPFPYTYNNVDQYYAGGTLDLTSNVPATANSWAWVKVGVNPVTNTAVAVTGTAQLKSAPLTASQLASVAFSNYVPLMGIKVRNGQASISNIADFISWRLALGVITSSAYVPLQPTTDITINDSGGDFNFVIESDTDPLMFNIDAGLNLLAIGGAVVSGLKAAIYGVFGVKAGGASATFARVGGRINVNTTTVGNVGAGEDDLMSYTIPAAVLSTNGDTIEFKRAGTFAASANNKQYKVKYGATTIFDTGVLVITAASDWSVEGLIIRTGAATQKAIVTFRCSDVLVTVSTDYTTPAETLSGTVVLKATGEGVSDNDIVEELCVIDWRPNA